MPLSETISDERKLEKKMQSIDRFIWILELLGNSRNGLMITEIGKIIA
ncbi:MAG: hypothetical protein ACOX4J_00155 [Anaerovoracaceae bacterium]